MTEDSSEISCHVTDSLASSHARQFHSKPNSIDEASALLQLAGRLHTARGDSQAWFDVLTDYRNIFKCHGVLDVLPHADALTPDVLAALAGQLSHCANYGDDCGHQVGFNRQRCAAFAVHMHTAAESVHKAHRASLFDHLAATWVLDRSAHVHEANSTAKDLARMGERVKQVGSKLELVGPGGSWALLKALAKVQTHQRLPWKDVNGKDVSFLLRALPDPSYVSVTALLDAPSPLERAPLLAEQPGLTPRQSELAAHLLADQTLAGAARAMGISRHTANEHLVLLQQRTGAMDRKSLLVMLRRIAQR